MATAEQLRAAFPQHGEDQIQAALRRAAGDPDWAASLLISERTSRDAGNLAARPPDLRADAVAWFRHYDQNSNGLERHEVVEAILDSFPYADKGVVRELVSSLWPLFDTDRSGVISLREFTCRDGFRDALLAELGHAASPPEPGMPDRPQQPPPMQAQVVSPPWTGAGPTAVSNWPQGPPQMSQAPAPLWAGTGEAAVPTWPHLSQQTPQPPGQAWEHSGLPLASGQIWSGGPMRVSVTGRVPKLTGRRRALLVGINYFGTRAELRGCINDVHNMKRLLVESFGWPTTCIWTLTDDCPHSMPTKANIEASLRWLVEDVRPGDVLFFHFSGHGAQQEDPNGLEEDGMNETILPVDFEHAGMMTDDLIASICVHPLPEGVRLTAVMDCCHSGTGLDLPFTWVEGRGWKEDTNPYHSVADVQLISGCEDDDTSSDAMASYGAAGGAMTTAFCDVNRGSSRLAYPELARRLNKLLRRRGFRQKAQLSSTQRFDVDRPFHVDDIIPNSNDTVGRTVRRRFKPQPRALKGPLRDVLGLGAAALGGMVLGDIIGDVAGGFLGGFFD